MNRLLLLGRISYAALLLSATALTVRASTTLASQIAYQGTSGIRSDGAPQLQCELQKLEGEVAQDGLWLRSTEHTSPSNPFRVAAVALGRSLMLNYCELELCPPEMLCTTGAVRILTDKTQFLRAGLIEEYSVSADGIRQDFVLEQSPAGFGELQLTLEVTGAVAEASTAGAQLTLNGSNRQLAYHRLRVTDSTGRDLPARMIVQTPGHLEIRVRDEAALYPITIDPTFSDADWLSWTGLPGVNGTVRALAFDDNGNLYVGGEFTVAGHLFANGIAKWDGNAWTDLNWGVNGVVNAIAVSGTDVYVGGSFTSAGNANVNDGVTVEANNVAAWNGTEWRALGWGVDGPVHALAITNNSLYAGGGFTMAGSVPAARVAIWNGADWSNVGIGFQDGQVNALLLGNGYLYAGGTFTRLSDGTLVSHVAGWNGTAWFAMGTGITGGTSPEVRALSFGPWGVYAGGTFTKAGTVAATNLAMWAMDKWSSGSADALGPINAIVLSGTDFIVAGNLSSGGVSAMSTITGSWKSFGNGVASALAIAAKNGKIAAGGTFTTPGSRVAVWSGTTWTNLGTGFSGTVYALLYTNNNLYVGGSFRLSGLHQSPNIVCWNGSEWQPIGRGLNGSVRALAYDYRTLYVGGTFTRATNSSGEVRSVGRITSWDGYSWGTFGTGMNSNVLALAIYRGGLYAGGSFTAADGRPAYHFTAMAGLPNPGLNGDVNALVVQGDNLFIGGKFVYATNGTPGTRLFVNNVAKWDGMKFSALGLGMDGPVNALAAGANNTLYAGGVFSDPARSIAQWNGSAWSQVGNDPGPIDVRALAVSGSNVYVGGVFSAIDTLSTTNIALWDGSSWSTLGSGISGVTNSVVHSLLLAGNTLYAGGNFSVAGNIPAGSIARADLNGTSPQGTLVISLSAPSAPINIAFKNGTPGRSYGIQSSSSLEPTGWNDLTNFTYSGPMTITLPVPEGTSVFFRTIRR